MRDAGKIMVGPGTRFQHVIRGLAFATALVLFGEAQGQTPFPGLQAGLDVNSLDLANGTRWSELAPLSAPPDTPVSKRPGATAGDRTAERRGNPLWGIPLSSLKVTLERPIFSPSRRPPVVAAAPPPPQPVRQAPPPPPPKPDPIRLALVGTIAGGPVEIAVLYDQASQSIVRLRTGERHDGWMLRSVRNREVTMERDRESVDLALPAPGEQENTKLAQLGGIEPVPPAPWTQAGPPVGGVASPVGGPATPLTIPVAAPIHPAAVAPPAAATPTGPATPPVGIPGAAPTPPSAPPSPAQNGPRMPNARPATPPV